MRRHLRHALLALALGGALFSLHGTSAARESYKFVRHNRRGALAGTLALFSALQVAGRHVRPRWRLYAAVPVSLAGAMAHAKLAEATISFPLAEQAVLIGCAAGGAVAAQTVADWLGRDRG